MNQKMILSKDKFDTIRSNPYSITYVGIHKSAFYYILQACVKERATKSILCVRDVTEEEAKIAVESVFPSCFKDILPFERIPP